MATTGAKRKRTKRTYDDQFRASAVLMLKSQGYPEMDGSLSHVAKHLKIPAMTLRGWFTRQSNPPPTNILNNKKEDLRTLFMDEIYHIMNVLPDKRDDASYGTLASATGIFFDKIRLLDGLPTEIVHVMSELYIALKDIDLEPSDVFNGMLAKAKAQREAVNANR